MDREVAAAEPRPGADREIVPGYGRIARVAALRWRALFSNRRALVGVAILATMVAAALLAPVLTPGNAQSYSSALNEAPSWAHLLGTNNTGQDVLRQLLWGARISLSVAFCVALVANLVGVIVGLGAAYFGGLIDEVLSLAINIMLVLPGLPLLIILASLLKPGIPSLVVALSATSWAWVARVLRAQALSLRQREFVESARAIGEPAWRVVLFEMLPNMWSVVVTHIIGIATFAIAAEAAIEFLGLGDLRHVTWGTMLNASANGESLLLGTWWTFVPPGLALAVTAFSLALVNYSMDEMTNPVLRTSKELRALRRKYRGLRAGRITPVVRR